MVVRDRPVPAWVDDWCRHSERRMRVLSATDPPDRLGVIASLAGSAVLLPHPSSATRSTPRPVVAAVRDLPDDDEVLAAAAEAARELGAVLSLTHVVPLSFAERSVGLDDAVERGRRLLDRGVERLATCLLYTSPSPRDRS